MAQAVHSSGRAQELIDQVRADHLGETWDDKRIVDIRLLSSPDEWPPTIHDAASGLWQALVSVYLLDATEAPPEHSTT